MSVQTVTSTIVYMKEGMTKTGKDMVKLGLNDVEETIWAFAWGVKWLNGYKQGDTITVDYADQGDPGKPFLCLKKVHAGAPSGGGGATAQSSNSSGPSKYKGANNEDRRVDMYTSYVKDLVVNGLTVKKALSTLSEIQEGVKNLLNPPASPPANSKAANPAQEGRVRSLANQIGLDTDDSVWKNHVQKRYGTLTYDNAEHAISVLQGVIDGTHSWRESPDGELIFNEKTEQVTSE